MCDLTLRERILIIFISFVICEIFSLILYIFSNIMLNPIDMAGGIIFYHVFDIIVQKIKKNKEK